MLYDGLGMSNRILYYRLYSNKSQTASAISSMFLLLP